MTDIIAEMGGSDLEKLRELLVELEPDDIEMCLELFLGSSPPETLSLTSLILFTKTSTMKHMDNALRWAEEAAAAAISDQDSAARLATLSRMLAARAESLLRATQLGLANILDMILETKSDIKSEDTQEQALLHEACEGRDLSVLRVLLGRGCDPNKKSARNETALMVAAQHGDEAIVRLLLEHKADIEAEDQDGDSALHTAAFHGSNKAAHVLLENGARPAVCGGSGYTPMQFALNRGHLGLAKLLLKFDAIPDLADDTQMPLNKISESKIYREIELAQEIMFPASLTLGWLDHMRFVVAAEEDLDHDIALIEPGPGGTMAEPYIAVSYCWARTYSTEDPLLIRVPSRNRPGSTIVRKARASREILLRCLEYAAAKGVRRIWIDQECIHQDDAEDKKNTLQNMHLVYRRAKTTLVLLDRHVRTPTEITALGNTILDPKKCSELKARITGDRWFTRAWTCQEFGVTPPENLRYLVGWDRSLDVSGHLWDFASGNFNLRSRDIKQKVPRSWEFSHGEMGGISFEGGHRPHVVGLWTEIGMTGAWGEDQVAYTLIHDGVEKMYWWKHGLSFRFSAGERDVIPNMAFLDQGDSKLTPTRQEWPELRMRLLAALSIQRQKACTVFSDKLAILGNLTDYPYRLHPGEVIQKQLSFSACALAMALFNGDLSPLFTNDLAFLDHNSKAEIPRGLLLSQTDLSSLADGRSSYSRCQAKVMAGSKCLIIGGKVLVEGLLWEIIPFTKFGDLEKTIKSIPEEDVRDPIRFHFLQALVRRMIHLNRIDLLELVVASVMRRQLASPLELVHLLNGLQAWFCSEQDWPASAFEESFLERSPAAPGLEVSYSNGKKKNIVRYARARETKGVDFAMAELESDELRPKDLLSYIHQEVLHGRPLALGKCQVGNHTLVSLFVLDDPSQHQWVLTPVNELEYEFGKNPWLHTASKDTFWCVTKGKHTASHTDLQKASKILNLEMDGEKHLSDEILEVVTSGTRSSFTGTWSPRLSRRGVLTIADDGLWEMIPLEQVAKYFWLAGI